MAFKPPAFTPPPRLDCALPGRQLRRRLAEMNASLYCSIIGTCLSCAELRKVVAKLSPVAAVEKMTDHDMHQEGVQIAMRGGIAAKLLQKALDARHESFIRRFSHAHDAEEVLAFWNEARAQGDIPGAYWAALTHPATSADALRKIFGDVHMLSHLVGSANRADVRRLAELETEAASLRDKVERQEARLRSLACERDEKIRALDALSTERLLAQEGAAPPHADTAHSTRDLVRRLKMKLDRETARRRKLEQERDGWRADRQNLVKENERLSRSQAQLEDELKGLEAHLESVHSPDQEEDADVVELGGRKILYVGGHPQLIPDIRRLVESSGGIFLHHDGGRADAMSLLPGLVNQAEVALFPIDCVSHGAAGIVKKLCKQNGKAYAPLSRSGVGGVLRMLRSMSPA